MKKWLLVLFLFFITIACCAHPKGPEISQTVKDRVALCSGGYKVALSNKLATELSHFAVGISLSSETEKEIKGIIFSKISNDKDAFNSYLSYLSCVKSESSNEEIISIVKKKSEKVSKTLLLGNGYETEAGTYEDIVNEWVEHMNANERIAAHFSLRKANQLVLAVMLKMANDQKVHLPLENFNPLLSKDEALRSQSRTKQRNYHLLDRPNKDFEFPKSGMPDKIEKTNWEDLCNSQIISLDAFEEFSVYQNGLCMNFNSLHLN